MDREGVWSLTPAYDMTFARGRGWTAIHQMRVRDKRGDIREADLVSVAEEFGIKKADRVLERARTAIAGWEGFAARYEVLPDAVRAIRRELDARALSVSE